MTPNGLAPGAGPQLTELPLRADFHAEPDPRIEALVSAAAQARALIAGPVPSAFVQTDGRIAAAILVAAREQLPLVGNRFGEWGSGLGLVSLVAAHLGYRATGIEIDPLLVTAARALALSQGLEVSYSEGSYKPDGFFEGRVSAQAMAERGADAALFDFDLIYAYALPSEAEAILSFFAAHARPGTVLLLYRGGVQISAWRRN